MRAWVLGGLALATLAVAQLDTKPIEVSQNYRGPEGSIELEGVCKIDETSVSCWKADRSPHPELQERVVAYAAKRSGFSAHYGYKTRYAFFRITSANDHLRIDDHTRNSFTLGTTAAERLTAILLVAEGHEQSNSARFSAFAHAKESEPLRLTEGATLSYQNAVLKVDKIVRSQLDPLVHGIHATGRWLVHVSFDRPLAKALTWRAVGRDDNAIEVVNFAGEPQTVEPGVRDGLDPRHWRYGEAEVPNLLIARVETARSDFFTSLGKGSGLIEMNIDPKYIKHLKASAQMFGNITVKDIPMEPKR